MPRLVFGLRAHVDHDDVSLPGLLDQLFAADAFELVGRVGDSVQSHPQLNQVFLGRFPHGHPKIGHVGASKAVEDELAVLSRRHQTGLFENFQVRAGQFDLDRELTGQGLD